MMDGWIMDDGGAFFRLACFSQCVCDFYGRSIAGILGSGPPALCRNLACCRMRNALLIPFVEEEKEGVALEVPSFVVHRKVPAMDFPIS